MFSIFRTAIRSSSWVCAICLSISWVQAGDAAKKGDGTEQYPLSTELKVLERDLSNRTIGPCSPR
jgi:hypothetical protein